MKTYVALIHVDGEVNLEYRTHQDNVFLGFVKANTKEEAKEIVDERYNEKFFVEQHVSFSAEEWITEIVEIDDEKYLLK